MATSLDATDVTVVRPTGTVSPTDYSSGPADNNDHWDFGGHDGGTDDNDFPGSG
jgi:hypothetical protein